MKKSLLALAVLGAFAGAAQAQTSVTMFGVVDASVARMSASGKGSNTGIASSGINSSRFGVRGTESLGGGLNASFWLEAGINNDNGNFGGTNTNNQATGASGGGGLTFNRRSTVSLSGDFGEVRIGRDYTPTFWNLTINDPFGTNGVGSWATIGLAGLGNTAVRASNSVGYFLPNLGGIYGQVMLAAGENNSQSTTPPPATPALSTKKDGNYAGFRVGYAAGPIDVALSYGKTNYALITPFVPAATSGTPAVANGYPAATGSDTKATNIAASYNFGIVKPMFVYQDVKTGTQKRTSFLLGATAPLGAGEARLAYSRLDVKESSNDANQFALGYVYNLSKRTAAYGAYSRLTNKGNGQLALGVNGLGAPSPLPGGNSQGYEVGVRHSF
jgi:predicted porin